MRRSKMVVSVCTALVVVGCDKDSPTELHSSNRLTVPDQVAFAASASGMNATPVSWSEIDISWATSPSASGYQVWRSTTGAAGSYSQIATTGATVSKYADTGLLGSTQYCYEIRSFKNAAKNTTYGAFSSALCATTLPPPVAAPSQTNAVPEGHNVRINWTDNSANEDGFRIEMAPATNGSWTQVGTVGANVTTVANWEELEHQVCFHVIAYNAVGPSNPSTPDCTTIPATPTNLSAKALDAQSITLAWTDNSAAEDGYKVSRLQNGTDWIDIATVAANVVSYRDATAAPNTSYTYRVSAVKDGGYSVASNDGVAVIATSVPVGAAGVWAYFDGQTDYGTSSFLTLEWVDASSNEEGFRIEYSADTLAGWTLYTQTGPNITSYEEKFFGGPAGCFRVIAFNNVGLSVPSNATCGEMRGAASDLVATAVDYQTIDLTWTDNAGYESGFTILRTTSVDSSAWEVVADVGPNTTSYRDTGLASGQAYTYYVYVTYNTADVCCGMSNYATATTPSNSAAPSASVQSLVPPKGRPAPTRIPRIKPRLRPPTSPTFGRIR